MEGPAKEYRTTDLALAAWLKMRGLRLTNTELGEAGRTVFVFEDSMDLGDTLKMQFANSEFQRFDGELRHIKRLIIR